MAEEYEPSGLTSYSPSALDEETRIKKATDVHQRLLEQRRKPAASALRDPPSPIRNLGDVAKRSAINYLDQDDDFELPCDDLPGVEDEHVEQAFKEIDFDDNGFIGISELRYLLTTMGERPTDEELEEMISMVDSDGKGQVSYDEFRSLFGPDSEVLDEMVEMRPPSASSSDVSGESSLNSDELRETMRNNNTHQDLLIVSSAAFMHRVKIREHAKKVAENMPKTRKKGEGQLRARPKVGSFALAKGNPTAKGASPPPGGKKSGAQRGSVFTHNPAMF